MFWFLRKFIKIIVLLTILGLLAGLTFIYFINPNDYKKQITQSLGEYFGLPIKVQGPVQWSLGSKTMLHLKDIVISQPGNDTERPIAEIKDANMHFDIFSYIRGDLIVNDLELSDVTLDLTAVNQIPKDAVKYQSIIQNLTIKNISVLTNNPIDHLNWQLKNATLTAKNIMINSEKPLPNINISGDLINVTQHATLNLDTTMAVNPIKQQLTLEPLKLTWNNTPFHGHAKINQYNSEPIIMGALTMDATDVDGVLKKLDPYYANSTQEQPQNMQAQFTYNFETKSQILDLNNIHFEMGAGSIDGSFKMSFTSPHQSEFSLTADNVNIKRLSQLGKALFPSLPSQSFFSIDLIKQLTINGKLAGTHLHFNNNLQIDNLTLNVVGQNGIVQIAPLSVTAYGGTHNITINLDVINKEQPFIQLTEQADQIDIEPWLKLIHETAIINGTANIKASLEAMGNDSESLKQTLTGDINTQVNNGVLYGINIDKLMSFTSQTVTDIFNEISKAPSTDVRNLAIKKASDWINTQQDVPKTKFSYLEIKASIEQGISKKASISMNNSTIDLKATGGFDLGNNTLNFNAVVLNNGGIATNIKPLDAYIKKAPLELLVTGTIQKPLYGPNIQGFAVNVLQLAKTDLTNQGISKMVAATPPNSKTSKTATELFVDSLSSLTR